MYWSNGTGTITQANLDGGNTRILVSGPNGQEGVAVNTTNLYWADFGGGIVEANLVGVQAQTRVRHADFDFGYASTLRWLEAGGLTRPDRLDPAAAGTAYQAAADAY